MEENINLDLEGNDNLVEVPKNIKENKKTKVKDTRPETVELISCLTNERVIVRYVPKTTGMIVDPKHVFFGGMAENATRIFTVPVLESNGQFVNVLTSDEKTYLEEVMGLEYNALSIYRKEDNFWENYTVRLGKGETILDKSNPDDYIKYKVLLANKDFVAPSLEVLHDMPRATYQYVLISEKEEVNNDNIKLNATMASYLEFGKIQDNADVLRTIIETLDLRGVSKSSKIEFLRAQTNKLIELDAKAFLKVVKDPLLNTKVLIKKCVEEGLISRKGNFYYLKADNSPLCENNEEPTLSMAAKYLNLPKRQELKFSLEAKLK